MSPKKKKKLVIVSQYYLMNYTGKVKLELLHVDPPHAPQVKNSCLKPVTYVYNIK